MRRTPGGDWTISDATLKRVIVIWGVVAGLLTASFSAGVAWMTATSYVEDIKESVQDVERRVAAIEEVLLEIRIMRRDVAALVRLQCVDANSTLEQRSLADLYCGTVR